MTSTATTRSGKRRALPEVIADELRATIVRSGEPGSELPREQELIDRYGVSKPTVREALRILEVEGLVTMRRGINGGAFVAEPSMGALGRAFSVMLRRAEVTLADVFVARQVIEPAAARLAAQQRNGAALREIVDREERILAEGGEIVPSEVEFHDALLEAGGSTTLASLGRLLEMIVAKHASDNMALYRGDAGCVKNTNDQAHRAHTLIVEAIEAGDAERAERRASGHLHAVLGDTRIDPDEIADIF
jgi:DNA-binding FadR family transcriptional regulator